MVKEVETVETPPPRVRQQPSRFLPTPSPVKKKSKNISSPQVVKNKTKGQEKSLQVDAAKQKPPERPKFSVVRNELRKNESIRYGKPHRKSANHFETTELNKAGTTQHNDKQGKRSLEYLPVSHPVNDFSVRPKKKVDLDYSLSSDEHGVVFETVDSVEPQETATETSNPVCLIVATDNSSEDEGESSVIETVTPSNRLSEDNLRRITLQTNLMLQRLLEMQPEIRRQNLSKMAKNTVVNDDGVAKDWLDQFPMRSQEEFELVNKIITEDGNYYRKLKDEIVSDVNGKTWESLVFNIMGFLMEPSAVKNITFQGKRGEAKAFKTFKIWKIIKEAVKVKHDAISSAEIGVRVNRWLTLAKSRKPKPV